MVLVCMMMVSFKPDGSDGKHKGHGYVDLGLSVKWATCNVGATSPEDFGHYFAWGETSPKDVYTVYNCSTIGEQMSDIAGDAQYDAATANWGGDWRMPTIEEMSKLRYECIWTWTMQNGVNGYNVEGPNGNSIFLPAAGYRYGSSLIDDGGYGSYWNSTPNALNSDYAYYLKFDSDYHIMYNYYRALGLSVRPVLE